MIGSVAKDYLNRKNWDWFILFLALVFVCVVRIRLLATPLERDEGEFAYMGQLMLQGIPPYKLAYNMKFPGIYAAYALIMAVFGQSIVGIHTGFLLVNAAAVVLVFILARKLFGPTAGAVSCVVYALLTVSRYSAGTSAHASHFVVLFAVAGVLALLKGLESARKPMFFWGGFLFGTSVLMKQPGLFFVLWGLAYLLYSDIALRKFSLRHTGSRLFWVALGAFVPVGVTCALLWGAGVFPKFWFWTFTYGREYATMLRVTDAPKTFSIMIPFTIGSNAPVWIAACAALVAATFAGAARGYRFFLWSFAVASMLTVSVGFYYRQHYFVFAAPAVALLIGAGVRMIADMCSGKGSLRYVLPLVVTLGLLGYPVYCQRHYLFTATPVQASRIIYRLSPFPECIEIGAYLKKHSKPTDKIAVIGSEPQIYFYAARHSATPHIYMYGLMEDQPYARVMQKEMINQVIAARPKFIIYVSLPGSWLITPKSDASILYWAGEYCRRYYKLVGIAEILSEDWTIWSWGAETEGYNQESRSAVYIFKRVGDG